MKRLLQLLAVAVFGLVPSAVNAAHTQARLVLSAATAKPGDTITAGVHFQMDPGWHIYWKNPGGPGIATTIAWELPQGITAAQVQWPTPEKLPAGDQTTYVYHDEVVLLVPLKLSENLKPGLLTLKANAAWLECEVACIPGEQEVEAKLEIGSQTTPSAETALLEKWQKKLPLPADNLSPVVRWEKNTSNDLRPMILEWTSPAPASAPDFFPAAYEQFEVQPDTEILSAGPEKIRLRKMVKRLQGNWPEKISGLLVQKSDGELRGFELTDKPIATSGGGESAALATPSLGLMLLYAFLGGMILNIMPCVLPVIALKILGFVSQAREAPKRVRQLGLIYALGVLASFLVLAALIIGVKAAGHRAGWGMQFSNPQFIVVFTVLITLVALNLFGVFEINLSGRVMGAAGNLASQHGASGAFFNGVLATVLATPCTAPFLGAALGFAFAQSAGIIVIMFLAVGAGLAAPYVLLSWNPAWLKFLPKPGVWMEKFKIAMGFPMLATAFWLFSLTTTFYGERSWWLGIFLVLVGAAAWVFGAFVQQGRRHRTLAAVITIVLLTIGYTWALDGRLGWRSPIKDTSLAGTLAHAPRGYDWQPWSKEAVESARASGRPVIVDFTAKWCATCNATVKPALEQKKVIAKLKELNAVALLADNTRFPPAISEELERYDRAGVPLVLVYSSDPAQPPQVLPEPLFSPAHYSGVILDALQKVDAVVPVAKGPE